MSKSMIENEKAKFEQSNPWAQKASALYLSRNQRQGDDHVYLAVMAVAFELNKMRTENINVEAQVISFET